MSTRTYTIVRTGRRPAPITIPLPDGRDWKMSTRRAVRDLTEEGAAAVAALPDTQVLESRAYVAAPSPPKPASKAPKPEVAEPVPPTTPKATAKRSMKKSEG